MRRGILGSLLGFVLLFGGIQVRSKNALASSEDEHLQRTLAVSLLRSISTSEHQYHAKHGRFATWTVLVGTSEYASAVEVYAKNQKYAALRNSQRATYPRVLENWDLRLSIGADGQTYDLTITDAQDGACRFSIFSNEKGLIWQGKAIDCPIE